MSAPAFTAGPWEAAERGDYTDYEGNSRVILGDEMRIAVVQHHGTGRDEANAHLIAAAPELYEALLHARSLMDKLSTDFPEAEQKFNGEWASYGDEFDAALAKARGEQ